jgi:MFS transporter, DHA1 family, inner membrane transport protein
VFLWHAVWMSICGAVLWTLLPRDPPIQPIHPKGWLARHLQIYASPRIAAPAMGFFSYTILFVALLTLLPAHVPGEVRATVSFWMPLAAIIVSLTAGVWILQHLSAVRTVQLGFGLAAFAVVTLWAVWGMPWPMAAAALGISAAFGLVQGASFAAIAELNSAPDDRAMAAGAIAQMGNLGTVTGTPLLAWAFTQGEAGALLLLALPLCLGGILVHAVQRRRRLMIS